MHFPPSFCTNANENLAGIGASWSIHARLMPFLDLSAAAARIELDRDWHDQVESGVTSLRMPVYLCASEPRTEVRTRNGAPYVAPVNYGFNHGTWLVFDPVQRRHGDGAFGTNSRLSPRSFVDGMSSTLAVAEVRTYQPYLRNTRDPGQAASDHLAFSQSLSGQLKTTGHTVWPDGRVHHSGITTAFGPNAFVPYPLGDEILDIDYTSQQEGKSDRRNTFASITARSHHSGRVNCLMMDGAVRTVADSIDLQVWRAMGTRAGLEVSGFSF